MSKKKGVNTDSQTGEANRNSTEEEIVSTKSEASVGVYSVAESYSGTPEPNVEESSLEAALTAALGEEIPTAAEKKATVGVSAEELTVQRTVSSEVGPSELDKPRKSFRKLPEIYQKFSSTFAFASRHTQRQPFTSPQNLPPPPHYFAGRSGNRSTQSPRSNNNPSSGNSNVHQIGISSFAPVGQMTPFTNIFNNTTGQWAPYPAKIPGNIPVGLSLLLDCDVLYVIQKIDFISLLLSGVDDPHLYLIINKRGECVYYVTESFNLCTSTSGVRSHQLHVMDVYNTEVMFLNLPCACTFCFCCYPILEVYSPPMVPLGAVIKVCEAYNEVFNILDPDENVMFKLYGPIYPHSFTANDFIVRALDANETQVGAIRREYATMPFPRLLDLDYYGVSFPINMDAKLKALIMSIAILVDFAYYDTRIPGCGDACCPCCTCCICC